MQDKVVLYGAPGMGHAISMVELAKLIFHHHSHQFSITILLADTDLLYNPSMDSYLDQISRTHPFISFHRFPPISVDTAPTRSPAAMVFESIRLNAPNVLASLREMCSSGSNGRVRALVIDLFCGSALSIGRDLNIPTYYFFTSGAACLAGFMYFPRIHEQYARHESFKYLTDTVLEFPGIPPLKAIHVPEPALDRDDPSYHDFLFFCSRLPKAEGIIVNTFEGLEPKAVANLAGGVLSDCNHNTTISIPPIYCIGPLIAAGEGSDRHDCLSWLDRQPSKGVVFLCFGSRGSFSVKQLREIANGLERSGQRFLWVVKKPPSKVKSKQTQYVSDFDLESILPGGFLERVKDRAMVVKSWVPQVTVLRHGSVGGFVTHCGWNSVLEAVVAGVPMVAWPLHAEQHMNRNVLVEEMKMAIAVEQKDEEDGFVSGAELEARVNALMDSDQGKKLRETGLLMRQKALAALSGNGSSIRSLNQLIEEWKRD
uniref:Glycosyltransferase n=1 Tax=Rhizophora mucronata TaxID=61149 RepID=A0A2P2IPL9_RHIMU